MPRSTHERKPLGASPQALIDRGFTAVGELDGIIGGPGSKTRAGIRSAQAENGVAVTGEMDPAFRAALPGMPVRRPPAERAEATVKDLRAAGSTPIAATDAFGWLARAMLGTSALGGINASGALDKVKDTANQATATLQSVQSAVNGAIGGVQWIVAHWWIPVGIAGVWGALDGAARALQDQVPLPEHPLGEDLIERAMRDHVEGPCELGEYVEAEDRSAPGRLHGRPQAIAFDGSDWAWFRKLTPELRAVLLWFSGAFRDEDRPAALIEMVDERVERAVIRRFFRRLKPTFIQMDRERSGPRMAAIDACNARWGRCAVVPAWAGVPKRRAWSTKFEMRTPRYTTQVNELPVAVA